MQYQELRVSRNQHTMQSQAMKTTGLKGKMGLGTPQTNFAGDT